MHTDEYLHRFTFLFCRQRELADDYTRITLMYVLCRSPRRYEQTTAIAIASKLLPSLRVS